jgi:Cytochrome b(N-terminal)/b6/petB
VTSTTTTTSASAGAGDTTSEPAGIAPTEPPTWTGRLRSRALKSFPPEKLLPDRQPAYVASWIYVFGALTLGAFGVVLLSGAILGIEGPTWWHLSRVGLYVNSLHLWSTELFFFFMVIHLWGKFFMAAWRGRRRATWVTGVLAFLVSVATAFTGYLSQTNFDSEWIGTQAKDGINATGAGAFWNVLNFGQMLLWHVLLLPLVVSLVIAVHVLLVRRRGVVPPFAAAATAPSAAYDSAPLPTTSPALATIGDAAPEARPGEEAQ